MNLNFRMWHLQRWNQALHLKTWTNRSRKSQNQSQSERAQGHTLKLSMNMNLLSQERKVKLHIEVWKTVILNMLINCNLFYLFKHPNTAPQKNYKTLYCVLILTYLCSSLSCSDAANILFSSPADGCDAIHFTPSVSNSVYTICADFYLHWIWKYGWAYGNINLVFLSP